MATVYEKMKKIADNIRLRTGGTELLSLDDIAEAILTIGGEVKPKHTNQVPISIDTDGNVFNSTGYQDNKRVRSSGALGDVTGYVATGFIPVKPNDIIRFTCSGWTTKQSANTINFGYISNNAFTSVGSYTTQPATYGIYSTGGTTTDNIPIEESTGIWKVTVPNNTSITYFRMSCYGTGANLIVTVNEEITD